ncbi:hypothetical protein EKD16_00870 [Streptomonospora litoralis]|uniref:Uncharacterized protein n=1 Tax=Streptomonospora litoralis TaxID=2498135 RepID=A0A4P6Q004_9ACTN|nr:hypothetical protein EKD16_00870 [Streptomonospora litoralis]
MARKQPPASTFRASRDHGARRGRPQNGHRPPKVHPIGRWSSRRRRPGTTSDVSSPPAPESAHHRAVRAPATAPHRAACGRCGPGRNTAAVPVHPRPLCPTCRSRPRRSWRSWPNSQETPLDLVIRARSPRRPAPSRARERLPAPRRPRRPADHRHRRAPDPVTAGPALHRPRRRSAFQSRPPAPRQTDKAAQQTRPADPSGASPASTRPDDRRPGPRRARCRRPVESARHPAGRQGRPADPTRPGSAHRHRRCPLPRPGASARPVSGARCSPSFSPPPGRGQGQGNSRSGSEPHGPAAHGSRTDS